MSDTLNINGENYTVYIFRGKVLKNRTYTTSKTEVTSSGGSGVLYKGTGRIKPSDIRTHTTHTDHTELYLEDSEGRQNVTEISGVRLQALAGHDVIKIWIIREGNERGPTVGFYNVTLNKFFWLDGRWKEFHRHTVWIALLQMGCLFIAFGVAFYFGRMFESWLVFWALFIGVLFGIINFAGNLEDANQQRVLGWKRQIAALLDKYCFQKKAA